MGVGCQIHALGRFAPGETPGVHLIEGIWCVKDTDHKN